MLFTNGKKRFEKPVYFIEPFYEFDWLTMWSDKRTHRICLIQTTKRIHYVYFNLSKIDALENVRIVIYIKLQKYPITSIEHWSLGKQCEERASVFFYITDMQTQPPQKKGRAGEKFPTFCWADKISFVLISTGKLSEWAYIFILRIMTIIRNIDVSCRIWINNENTHIGKPCRYCPKIF